MLSGDLSTSNHSFCNMQRQSGKGKRAGPQGRGLLWEGRQFPLQGLILRGTVKTRFRHVSDFWKYPTWLLLVFKKQPKPPSGVLGAGAGDGTSAPCRDGDKAFRAPMVSVGFESL